VVDIKTLGQRIRKLRMDQGLTEAQLADKAKITEGHVSHVERGYRTPSLPVLRRIIAALGATADEVMEP
jgi:transcriptional regulator with XRE-family HTH domain